MSRVTKPAKFVRGRRYRITRLDQCGNPIFGDNAQIVVDGVVTASWTANTNSTDEIRVTNSNGDTCLLEPAETSLESYTVEFEFCGMNPDLFNILTGMPVNYDANGAATGFRVDTSVSLESFAFAVEIWTGVSGGDACGTVGAVDYGYFLAPFMKGGHLSDFEFQNDAITFTISDATTREGGGWGVGPYNVFPDISDAPGPLISPITKTQIILMDHTTVAPPAAYDEAHPVMNPTWTPLTNLVGTPDDLDVDFVVTPTIGAHGVYYDFGDGTWDYVTTAGGNTTHTYDAEGTYTVTATSNGLTVVTTTVTVTEGS